MRPELRRAERVRHAAGPAGRLLPPRAVRDQRAVGARIRAGDEHARDHLACGERVGGRPRRAHARSATRRGHRHAALAAAVRRRRRPPARAHGRVHRGQRRPGPRVRAGLRLRSRARRLEAGRRRPSHGRRERRRPDHPPPHGHAARDRGRPCPRPPAAAPGRAPVLLPVVGRGPRLPRRPRRGGGAARRHHAVLAGVDRTGPDHRPRLARADRALGAGHQGPDLHAHGGDGRRADHLTARDAGRRAQLGLPLHVDPRLDLHAAGAPLAEPGLGGRRVHAVHRRPRARRGRRAPDHVRHRRAPRPDGERPGGPLGLRGGEAGPDRQRRLRPAPERRLRGRARLDPAPSAAQRAAPPPAVADGPGAGGVRDPRLAGARPGNLGGARRAAALRFLQAHVLGGARSGRQAGRDPR